MNLERRQEQAPFKERMLEISDSDVQPAADTMFIRAVSYVIETWNAEKNLDLNVLIVLRNQSENLTWLLI
jgi:hypothetical protein